VLNVKVSRKKADVYTDISGSKGGKARAAVLTPEERTKSAAKVGMAGRSARAKMMTKAQRRESEQGGPGVREVAGRIGN
jgi:hypothetical protein